MQTTGKVIEKLPEVSGENEKGFWCRSGVVLLTADDRGESLCFEVSGRDRCMLVSQLAVGETIVVTWRPSSHKYGERWFSTLHAYEILRLKKEETKNV